MSFIGSLFSDSQGAGFQAQSANVANPSTQQQADTTYAQEQGSLAQQSALASALQAQGGLQNQSNTYNQLQNVSQNGSQLANAQLTGATNQGIQQAAGTVASQKGLNPALAARMAGEQAANSTQTAANQSAQLQAQTQLNALGQQASLANQQAGQQIGQTNTNTQTAMGMNNQVLQGIQGQNNANVSNVGQQNSANSAIAKGNQGAQSGLVGGLMNSLGTAATMLAYDGGKVPAPKYMANGGQATQFDQPMQDMGGPNYAAMAPGPAPAGQVPMTAQVAQVNNPIAKPKSSAIAGILKGNPQSTQGQDPVYSGASALGNGLMALGKSLFGGAPSDGSSGGPPPATSDDDSSSKPAQFSPSSKLSFNLGGDDSSSKSPSKMFGVGNASSLMSALPAMARGGKVPAMVSPGEIYLKPREAREVAKGKKSPMSGERIAGVAPVRGNSIKNDIVPKTLDEGGVVIPKSILEGPRPHQEAYKFVNAVLGKGAMKRKAGK